MDHDLGILGFLNSPIYASPQFSFIDPPSLSNHVQASELEDTTMETHGSFIFRGYELWPIYWGPKNLHFFMVFGSKGICLAILVRSLLLGSLTVSENPWKMTLGRRSSPFGILTFQGFSLAVKLRGVYILSSISSLPKKYLLMYLDP